MSIKKVITLFFIMLPNVFNSYALSIGNESSKSNTELHEKNSREFIPKKQREFVNILEEFAEKYKNSSNAIKRFLLRKKRKEFISKHLKDRKINDWIGQIITLETTEDGYAYLEIELPKTTIEYPRNKSENSQFKLIFKTFSNPTSDLKYETLIMPENPLYNWLSNFKEDEWVFFSGNSFLGDKDYFKIAGLNEFLAMTSPKFIFKFEFFEKINFIAPPKKTEENAKPYKIKKKKESQRNNFLNNTKNITIRFYQNFRLSNYNWNYKKFITRWHRLVRYHWNNNPPEDYLDGTNPKGGEIFVLVTVKRNGKIEGYEVNSVGEVSDNMKESALEAVRVVSLPPIPEDFPDEELKVEFRFEHSRIFHHLNGRVDTNGNTKQIKDNLSNNSQSTKNKTNEKIFVEKLLSNTKASFNEELKQELSSHFKPVNRFNPNLEIKIELALDKNGNVIEKKIISPTSSIKFYLAVMNSLSKARFGSLPKSLTLSLPYRILLRIIP